MPTIIRRASHAGSWYSDDARILDKQLSTFLDKVKTPSVVEDWATYDPPIKGCKAIIAPHAGYSYSGPAAAWAYKSIDTTGMQRVFIVGPSHHVYLDSCALSTCTEYETPIGNLPLNKETIDELMASGKFQYMDLATDEDEHSIELHLPFVRKIFESANIKIVPIMVGSISQAKEAMFGSILAPYLLKEDVFFVISSDFCHWGTRFSFTNYYPPDSSAVRLGKTNLSAIAESFPIYKSISSLDHSGMSIIAKLSKDCSVHQSFAAYLAETGNTICGRHPIGVLLGAIESLENKRDSLQLRWVRYEQSSECISLRDSSVSYASAYVVL